VSTRSDAADRSTHILILVTREGVGERGNPDAQVVELSGHRFAESAFLLQAV